MLAEAVPERRWLCGGRESFPAMLAAIDSARESVCLETYIFAADELGRRFLLALVQACQRGARVRVLVDAFGSMALPGAFWNPLRAAGGEVRYFNPLALNRLGIRNHRKLLVCDNRLAVVGGFNIAAEYDGDGVSLGWQDIGLEVGGVLAAQLAVSFEDMFARAGFQHGRFMRLRKFDAKRTVLNPKEEILLSGPGRGQSPIKHALRRDLRSAAQAQIMVAYFLPTWRLRRDLFGIVRRGGSVDLILAGKSDVLISQLAGQSLYRRFLNAGVSIYEYQPQVLHAKLFIVDDAVYVGSANLDQRSLNINYELMIRFEDKRMAGEARWLFTESLKHCRRISSEQWRESRTFWRRLQQRWAYWLLVRIDPYLAQQRWGLQPD